MTDRNQLVTRLSGLLLGGAAAESATGAELRRWLLQETEAWAVGMWAVRGEFLEQVVFAAADGFDSQVAEEFAEATRRVSLEKTQLGIVNAVVHQRPALAVASDQTGDLRQSAGWLERFGAKCSLSCPLRTAQGEIVGVFAVSWRELHEESDPTATNLLQLASEVANQIPTAE